MADTPEDTEVVGHSYLMCITRALEQAPDPSNPYLAVEVSHFPSASFTTLQPGLFKKSGDSLYNLSVYSPQ
jgi:hypothetical protein